MQETKQLPEKKFRAGAVAATIWKNPGQKGEFKTVQLTRSYKDKSANWKTTSSFRISDLPRVALVANKAFEYLVINDDMKEDSEEEEEIADLL